MDDRIRFWYVVFHADCPADKLDTYECDNLKEGEEMQIDEAGAGGILYVAGEILARTESLAEARAVALASKAVGIKLEVDHMSNDTYEVPMAEKCLWYDGTQYRDLLSDEVVDLGARMQESKMREASR